MTADDGILVAGGGPSGCVAAIGLARLGYRVRIVTLERRDHVIEGLSERVVAALEQQGCRRALSTLGPPCRRRTLWQGITSEANQERVVDRLPFDAAILADAEERGVELLSGRLTTLRPDGAGWRAMTASGRELAADFLIDARGRRAPGRRRRGPRATALVRELEGLPRRGMTAVASMPAGWAWFATAGDGRGSLQLVLAPPLPKRDGLDALWRRTLERQPEVRAWLHDAMPRGQVRARDADTNRALALATERSVRVGDAALAIDPLAGHGLFEAIASALASVPVVNTLLQRPAAADLARGFYEERTSLAFERFARTGRDFYRLEMRHAAEPFWTERRHWPDDRPAHPAPDGTPARIVEKPVIEDGFITLRPVIVTGDQPRGVWQVDGVPLAPLLDLCRRGAGHQPEHLAEHLGRPPGRIATALAWLRLQQLL